MKIKTKSGFVCDVSLERAQDWRFTKLLAKWTKDENGFVAMADALNYLLGDDGESALMEHVKDEKGHVPAASMISEFKEILNLLGEKVKKSGHSQA
jgi:hypothetical protein